MELIKIYRGRLINARELHGFLEVKTEFRHWIKRMLEYGFEEKTDYVLTTVKKDRQVLKEYFLTIGTAKEISMLQRTDKGKQARRYFIECEEQLNALAQSKRFEAFYKLEVTKSKLKSIVEKAGHGTADYLQIDLAGSRVLMNGQRIPDEELNTLLLKARDFSTALTNEILKKSGTADLSEMENINREKHEDARHMLLNSGIVPEELPAEPPIRQVGQGKQAEDGEENGVDGHTPPENKSGQ